jgi:murein DD-endopeptidase MepM/ murein hydrolase activator NlpD
MAIKSSLLLLLALLFIPIASAQAKLNQLNNGDVVFRQLTADINENNRRFTLGKPPLAIVFYQYTLKKEDSLYKVAARLNLSYDSLVSLNNIASPLLFDEQKQLLIPNMSGIAVRGNDQSQFFSDLALRLNNYSALDGYVYSNEKNHLVHFYPNQRFTADERRVFLASFFRSPLNGKLITTSTFGSRSNPFSGKGNEHHNGIDLRSPLASPVYAVREGRVIEVKNNDLLGLYIVVQHEAGYQSFYGHLQQSVVIPNDKVRGGQLIAYSGNSGRSTGPHLHFEVHRYGRQINPAPLLQAFS